MSVAHEAYAEILSQELPHRLRTDAEYRARLAEARSLIKAERTKAQSQYLDLLGLLIEDWERSHVRLPKASPIHVLHELMEAHSMKQADLARFTGSSGTASEIYHGKRGISVRLAKRLARHFHVSFAVFL